MCNKCANLLNLLCFVLFMINSKQNHQNDECKVCFCFENKKNVFLHVFVSAYDVLLMPSLFEFVNCSNSRSESSATLPPVCWLTERAIFCFCLSSRSFSRAIRNCSKSSDWRSIWFVGVVQSTSSSMNKKNDEKWWNLLQNYEFKCQIIVYFYLL